MTHGLRFVPIKGADLAYRVYQDAALRVFNDWDVWFHPDDCDQALAILAKDGWRVAKFCQGEYEIVQIKGKHHFSALARGGYKLEPHFTLPNFEGISPYEIWEHTVEYPAGNGQHVLSPELNLLMLMRHSAANSYYHAQIPKLLTDVAMVMREPIDFDKLRELTTRWRFPYPGDLLAAFPEFFPPKIIEGLCADPEKKQKIREIFELRGKLGKQDFVSLSLERYKVRNTMIQDILKQLCTLSPNKIRYYYRLPKHGVWGHMIVAYFCWFWTRSQRAIIWIKTKSLLREYTQFIEDIECSAPHK